MCASRSLVCAICVGACVSTARRQRRRRRRRRRCCLFIGRAAKREGRRVGVGGEWRSHARARVDKLRAAALERRRSPLAAAAAAAAADAAAGKAARPPPLFAVARSLAKRARSWRARSLACACARSSMREKARARERFAVACRSHRCARAACPRASISFASDASTFNRHFNFTAVLNHIFCLRCL